MYYHVKVQKVVSLHGEMHNFVRGGWINYLKRTTWKEVEAEIRQAPHRQVTVLEVRNSEGKLCPF